MTFRRLMKLARCLAPVVLIARGAAAQDEPAVPRNSPAAPPKVTYSNGQLSITGRDSTLADVLEKIALLIGVKIEAPEAAAQERMPLVELTGPVRATLASLLQESSFDFLIQASETNRDEVQSVILLVREKSAGTNRTESAGRQVRSPFVRNAPSRPAVPESETAASSPVSQGENTLDAGAVTPAKDEGQAPAVSENAEQSDQTLQIDPPPERAQPLAQTPSGSLRPGALTPPPVLTPQAMSQQLLQMYQQRTQMMQQATGTNSTNK